MSDEPEMFECMRPEDGHNKVIEALGGTDLLEADIQLIRDGGANKLHHHTGQDGLFMVLCGRARFHGEGDKILAELSEREGIIIPHGTKYWFEKASEEPVEIFHVAAISDTLEDKRIGASSGSKKID